MYETSQFPLQHDQHFVARDRFFHAHVLELAGSLQRARGAQIAEFPSDCGRRASPHRIGLRDGLAELLQEFRRFLQENLA